MKRLSGLIRYDKEFKSSLQTVLEQLKAAKPLPIIVNGLGTGAADAYLAESIADIKSATRAPTLVIVSSESERQRVSSRLTRAGIRALEYKSRDLVFHNISASHDTERERLSVLSSIIRAECDAVVTTPSAALMYTVPEEMLMSLALGISVGDEVSPEELSKRLVTLGFIRVRLSFLWFLHKRRCFLHDGGGQVFPQDKPSWMGP